MAKSNLGYVLGTVIALAVASPANAAVELITNGNFETTSAAQSTQMNGTNNTNGNVTGWYTSGYNFIFLANSAAASGTQADTTGATNGLKLWGPGTGNANGLTTSPDGKNFVGADNNYQTGPISQSVTGLTAGAGYYLSFYWAAAQQSGYDGATQERWAVTFGSQSQSTVQYSLASHAFSGWMAVTMYFTASAATQTLSFLANGTPGGAPPFSLLDGVSLVAAPEPTTWALMLTGVVGLVAATRFARRNSKSAGSAQA